MSRVLLDTSAYSEFFRGHPGIVRASQAFLSSPRVRTVGITEETSTRYATILNDLRAAGRPIPTNDIWIAASAMEHGLRLLTTDTHYQYVRQVVVEYFEAYE